MSTEATIREAVDRLAADYAPLLGSDASVDWSTE